MVERWWWSKRGGMLRTLPGLFFKRENEVWKMSHSARITKKHVKVIRSIQKHQKHQKACKNVPKCSGSGHLLFKRGTRYERCHF